MNTKLAVFGGVVISALILTAAILHQQHSPEEKLSTWHPHFTGRFDVDAGFKSTLHRQWIDCTDCETDLVNLQQALDIEKGLGIKVDSGFVSTPAPSYYLDGGIALTDDGGLYAPTIHESILHTHPTVVGRYMFPILDRDHDIVMKILDGGTLPSPIDQLDDSWFVQ
jgi:hypothetical protein